MEGLLQIQRPTHVVRVVKPLPKVPLKIDVPIGPQEGGIKLVQRVSHALYETGREERC